MSEDEAPREAAWQTALKAKGLTKGKAWVCTSCGTENLVRDPRCKLCSEQKPLATEVASTTTTKARKWEMKEDKKFQFDFSCKPHPDINNICWAECEGVMKSAGGSGGVYFVATPVGGLVVKCSMTLFSEVFGSALGDALGLKTSKCRILAMDSTEGDEMFDKLCAIDKKFNGTGIIRADLQVKHVLIYAFAPGSSLETEQACESLLGPAGALSEVGLKRLNSIGRVMAFDMLCHNTDRLPLVSDNDGNVGNLLLSTAAGSSEVVLIDTAVACVDPKHFDTLGRYLDVCSRFLLKLFAAPHRPALNVLKVRDSIMEVTSFDIDARPVQEDAVSVLYDKILRTKDADKVPLVLVGNKCDLKDQRQVEYNEGAELARSWGCAFFETSAKIKLNNEACFFEVVREIRKLKKPATEVKKKAFCTIL